MDDMTVLVNTCDRYSEAWKPFFYFFNLNGGSLKKFPVVLMSETKEYTDSEVDLKVIHFPKKATWSVQIKNVLEKISTEYVFFVLDDYFLLDPINEIVFEKVFSFMKENKDVGYLRIPNSFRETDSKDKDFFSTDQRLYFCVSIWRTDYFLKILRDHESIWDCERYSVLRARQYPERVMAYSSYKPVLYRYMQPTPVNNGKSITGEGYGIVRGKWVEGNKELFEKHGIEVDFEQLGWYCEQTEEDVQSKKTILEKLADKSNFFAKVDRRLKKIKRQRAQKKKRKFMEKSTKI